MSEERKPLDSADNFMKHCSKCPNLERNENGRLSCSKLEDGGHGQLHQLVKEGMPCPIGKFSDKDEVKDKPVERKEPEKPHFIFTILESCKSATFHFDDGDLTWTKK